MSGPKPEFKPLQNVCEFLTAIHIYADEAREGKTRYVPAFHYCSHVREDLRECLIYDSHEKNARLIGVEYMVPKHVYETFPPEEQKLWHSHEFEVKSGMLILPKPEEHDAEAWEMDETKAMEEIIGLYGKTWHFWQTDAGHDFPFGKDLQRVLPG
ncbi:Oil body-associated protein 1B [Lasiodiplodia theobromae]|uniref:Oil body-associated protein 1B n=1 Tax=Lasiodiplodia theobromae TaxID=45133 RepID=A0A5N5DDF3_9PEZI|nr:Oil body-associated protein 1B [Lasiodiplodia theobromae]